MNTIIRAKETDKSEINEIIYKIVKRIIDIIISLIGCITIIPLTIIICIANILNKDKGPVFYKHKRIGKNGKPFEMYKFRTMCSNAHEIVKDEELMKEYFTKEQIKEWTENFKIQYDPRVTKMGYFLRRTSLDEFPNFINVLKGEMSIVGPRPVVQNEVNKYKENKEKFLSVIPGITGCWAVNGRSDTSYDERMKMELYYVDNANLKLDIKILLKTIVVIIKRRGAI